MSACLFCEQGISTPLSFSFIFSLKKLSDPLICKTCLSKFKPINLEQACLGCSRPQKEQTLCADCQQWQQEYSNLRLKHTALFTYNEMAKEYLKEFKFQGDLILAGLFAREIAKSLATYQKTHHIVPIPISKESLKDRGFNQVNLILEKSGIHYEDWLSHTGDGERQSTKNRKDRLRSKQFLVVNLEPSEAKQIKKPLLIVDDVYTTGRTMMHANHAFHQFETLISRPKPQKRIPIESFSLFR